MKFGKHASGLPCVDHGGEQRVCGVLRPTRTYSELPLFRDAVPVIPRGQWAEFQDDVSDITILNQNGEPSCCGHGGAGSFQDAWNREVGVAETHTFAPTFLYSLVNGGQNHGAIVGDLMGALKDTGVCLFDTMPDVHNWNKRNQPQAAFQEAQRFKLQEAYRVETFDELVTAILLKRRACLGIDIGAAFEPGSDGVIPKYRRGRGYAGHCMWAGRGLRNINGVWHVLDFNSWSETWGKNGTCWLPESYFNDQSDIFVPVTAFLDPNSTDPLPVAK